MNKQHGLPLLGVIVYFLTTVSAHALVSDVNGLFVKPNVVLADPGTNLTIDVNGFPTLATIHEDGFTNRGFGAQFNRHDLMFSADGGASPRKFLNQEAFDISVDLTLDAGFDSPRKEAGLRINYFGFDGQFIVNSDAGEIVAFGGTLPFYSFTESVGSGGGGLPLYMTGETINMRMVYKPPVFDNQMPPVLVPGMEGTIQYIVDRGAGPISSPVLPFSGTESGIIDNSEVGVYSQATGVFPIQPDFVDVTFANFGFEGPSTALAGDFDFDGEVDGRDFLVWQRGGTTPPLDAGLLADWRSNYGMPLVAAVGAVPEPTTGVLIALGLVSISTIRRRHC